MYKTLEAKFCLAFVHWSLNLAQSPEFDNVYKTDCILVLDSTVSICFKAQGGCRRLHMFYLLSEFQAQSRFIRSVSVDSLPHRRFTDMCDGGGSGADMSPPPPSVPEAQAVPAAPKGRACKARKEVS
eukprot:4497453-Pleurochrysis_carterae.AAC.1